MKIVVLASGSNGNATYIETKDTNMLIDCGITTSQLQSRMASKNLDINNIEKVFITHEHIDHIRALKVFAKKCPNFDLFITKGTYNKLYFDVKESCQNHVINFIVADQELYFGTTKVTVIRTHHDVAEPVGFIIEEDNKKVVYITDTGFVEDRYIEKLKNPDMLILESNYDVDLLFSSNRPYELKSRINSDHGHLSNYDSAVLASKIIGPNTNKILLAHISEDCNFYYSPDFIIKDHLETYEEIGLDTGKIEFIIGNREWVTGEWEL